MSYTKGELVNAALEEIGIAEYEFDISPEQVQSAIRRLDSMMAEWNIKGIFLSYPIAKMKDADPQEDSNTPDWSWEAIITNLAVRIAPSYGKQVSPQTSVAANRSFTTICGVAANPREMQFQTMPKGAGYKTTDRRYMSPPQEQYLERKDGTFDPSKGPV